MQPLDCFTYVRNDGQKSQINDIASLQ